MCAGLLGYAGRPCGSVCPSAGVSPSEHGSTLGKADDGPQLTPFNRFRKFAEQASFCFAPGTAPEVMAAWNAMTSPDGVAMFQADLDDRWPGDENDVITLTWSLVPDGVEIPLNDVDAPNKLFERMEELFPDQQELWIQRIQEAFDRWGHLTSTQYVYVHAPGQPWDDGAPWDTSGSATRGDIRIWMANIDGSSGVLAFNFFPGDGRGGDMVIDASETWHGGGNNMEHRFLRNVVMHEHGHGLGIRHVCPALFATNGRLMEPYLNVAFDGPRHDDIRAAQFLYGDAFEYNNTPALAHDLGIMPLGVSTPTDPGGDVPFGSLASIQRNADIDFYRFTLAGPRTVTVTCEPLGFSYDSSSQSFNGSCNSGNIIDSLNVANLSLRIQSLDQTTLAAGAGLPAGQTEVAGPIELAAGSYLIRVDEVGSPQTVQMYGLQISVQGRPECAADLDGDGSVGLGDLGLLLGAFGESAGGDIDGDDDTDLGDLGTLLSQYGGPCP